MIPSSRVISNQSKSSSSSSSSSSSIDDDASLVLLSRTSSCHVSFWLRQPFASAPRQLSGSGLSPLGPQGSGAKNFKTNQDSTPRPKKKDKQKNKGHKGIKAENQGPN